MVCCLSFIVLDFKDVVMANQENKDKNKLVKRPTSQKRELQSEKQRLRNKAVRSEIKTAIKAVRQACVQGDKEKKFAALKSMHSLVDKAVNKGVFKRNKASRLKSRLTAYTHRTV